MSAQNSDILIVDDEEDIRGLLQGILGDEGYSCRMAGGARDAYMAIKQKLPSVIILDIWLHGSEHDGLEILKNVKETAPEIPVIMISGHGTIETAVSALKLGAYDFIEKPFKSDRLLLMVRRALETSALKIENKALKEQVAVTENLVGESTVMQSISTIIDRVAPTNSRILITGEAGTGKNVIAREIHKKSNRADQAFLVLNCATLKPETIEEALFGSAENGEKGALERANEGTLLLDEVSDMPLDTQRKIVRLLQEQRYQKPGSNEEITLDVRVMASTNKDLEKAMEEGTFREDLYYRLNVVPLHIPALRERSQDITAMIEHFTKIIATQSNLPAVRFTPPALDILSEYHWPGNLRQLRNVVEWVMIMHDPQHGHVIDAHQLPPEITKIDHGEEGISRNAASDIRIISLPLRKAREVFEQDYLLSQINRFEGNISKTASFVGMERSALHRKLKSLGIVTTDKGAKVASDHGQFNQNAKAKAKAS